MMLSEEQVEKFQLLYARRFGKEIGREETYEQGVKLLRLVQLIYRPMAKAEFEKVQERHRATGDIKI